MWAQLIQARLKPGKDAELAELIDQLKATEEPGSGLLRSTAMRDQKDPQSVYFMVVFDSEESGRAREQDSRRQERLAPARELMAQIFEGPPEFTDLDVATESAY
jgi:quinol monooxygenase YgiN